MRRSPFFGSSVRAIWAVARAAATLLSITPAPDAEAKPVKVRGWSPRSHDRFQITQNSHPSKVARWMSCGGAAIVASKPHLHPRHLRKRAA